MRLAVTGVETSDGLLTGGEGTVSLRDSQGLEVWSGQLTEDEPGKYSLMIPKSLSLTVGQKLKVTVKIWYDPDEVYYETSFTADVWERFD